MDWRAMPRDYAMSPCVVMVDTIKYRRLHPAFLWGSLFLVSVQALSAWISGTSVWLHIAQAIMKPFA